MPTPLGDSHRGYRVHGTRVESFRHYRYGRQQQLLLAQGKPFDDLYDAALAAKVADTLDYQLGDRITLAHGASDVHFVQRGNKPNRVLDILKRTRTPVGRTLHVSLEAI